jgi:hypothetical protein
MSGSAGGSAEEMPSDTITLVLNGNVFVEDLAVAVSGWLELMQAVGDEVEGGAGVRWVVDELSAGSFFGTLRARYEPQQADSVAVMVREYAEIGRAAKLRQLARFSYRIQAAATRIVSVIDHAESNGRQGVDSVRFETDVDDTEIFSARFGDLEPSPQVSLSTESIATKDVFSVRHPDTLRGSYGAVRGRVESMTRRNQLRFTLYEVNTDRAVSCYLQPGSEPLMREAWGQMALVEGVVRRDPETGLATTVRKIRNVTVIPQGDRDAYKLALGCAPARPGSPSPEAAIRRLRDAQ